MKAKLPMIARILLGFIFFASGLVGLLKLAPVPPDLPERLVTFNAGLEASGYFLTLLKAVETVCGLLLLLGSFVPLALVILAPVVLNIFLVHAFMAPSGLPLARLGKRSVCFLGTLETTSFPARVQLSIFILCMS